MLLAGVKSSNIWNNMSDSHIRSEYMFSKYISQIWNGTKYGYYDTGTDFPGGADYNVSAVNLIHQLNEGYGFSHFAGHGNRESYTMETGLPFSINEASVLSGSSLGIMLSTSCLINAFDSQDPCLSEAFMRNPDGGCVAFFGSSRNGLYIDEETENLGHSFRINAKFFELLFGEQTHTGTNSFAAIANLAKTSFVGDGNSGSASYWYLLYAINPMGDPELPLYSRNPEEFKDIRLSCHGNSLTVSTGGLPGCRICVLGSDPGTVYHQVANDVFFYSFYDFPLPCQVIITKPGYVPYIHNVETITGINGEISSFVHIYPNPASDFLNIDFMLQEGILYIFDLSGNQLIKKDLTEGVNTIPLELLGEGVYIIKIHTSQGVGQFKLIK